MRTKGSGTVVLSLCALLFLSLAGYAWQQSTGTNKSQIDRPSQAETSATSPRPQPRLGTREEKVVRDAYARLMRYHTAARDEQAATNGVSFKPEDYVIFELRNIHTGPVEEIYDKQIGDLVTAATGDVMNVTPHHLTYGKGPKHAYYDVGWVTAPDQTEISQPIVRELLEANDKLADVDRYASFEVTARLRGKQRTYLAMTLYRSTETRGKPKAVILDQITMEMNTVLGDESPRVRSPWTTYRKSSLYLAVVKQMDQALKAGKPLIPENAPIGYLPGDDVRLPTERTKGMSIASTCPEATVTIPPGQRNVVVGTRGNQITLTATGSPSGGTYAWSTGSTHISLSNSGSATVTVSATSASSGQDDVTITVSYSISGQQASASTTLTVQSPTSLSLVGTVSESAGDCGQGSAGWMRMVNWQVVDQFGNPIRLATDVADAIVNGETNTCHAGPANTGNGYTDANGVFPDTYSFCAPGCVTGTCKLQASQTWVVNNVLLPNGVSVVYRCNSIRLNGQ